MVLLRTAAFIWLALLLVLGLLGFCTVEALKSPAQILMHERRGAFCSARVDHSDDTAFISCEECKVDFERLKHVFKHETNDGKRYRTAATLCNKFVSMFGYSPEEYCPKLYSTYLESIEYVIHADMFPNLCHIVGLCPDEELRNCRDRRLDVPSGDNYSDLNYRDIDFTAENNRVNGEKFNCKTPRDGSVFRDRFGSTSPNITFVQISDIHFDPEYKEGASTSCLQVVCCHGLFGEPIDISEVLEARRAGPFGDYHCDMPERTIRGVLDFVRSLSPPPDFIVYVGDSSVHAILETMRKKLHDNLQVTDLLVEKLGDLGSIYPVFGNHETVPQSFYFRPLSLFQTTLDSLGEQWPAMFNASEEQIRTIRQHGYYVAEINPTLWILNFNSLYSYVANIFALLGRLDPVWNKQKDYVRETLERARSENAQVIFTSHMRARYQGTYTEYAEYMESLVAEFSDVITLQIYGHDHDDSFLVHRDPSNSSRVVGTSLSAPSLTPFYNVREGVNPAIRVFTLERDTWAPLDYTQYYMDLEEANNDGEITMKEHYTFTEEYDLPDLSPASFASLSDRIYSDWTDFQRYERNYQILTNGRDRCAEDDTDCRRSLACNTRTAKPCDYVACMRGN